MLERLEDARARRAVAPGRAARGGGPRRGLARAGRRRCAGPATGAALRWVAASLTARGLAARAARLGRAHGRPRRARSRRTPTWTAASSSRSTCTRAWRRRSSCSATSSSTRRSRSSRDYDRVAAAAHRPRLRAQPGVDEPDRQRDRRARRDRHDHDPHAGATGRACWSTSPTTARGSRRGAQPHVLRPVLHHQGGRPAGRAWASTPRGGSSRSATAARWRFETGAGRHDLPRVAADRGHDALIREAQHAPASGDLHTPRHDHGHRAAREVAGCEDCLRDGRQVAASAHLPGVRPRRLLRRLAQPPRLARTRRRAATRSSARWSRARNGSGASPTRWRCASTGSRARRGSRRRRCCRLTAAAGRTIRRRVAVEALQARVERLGPARSEYGLKATSTPTLRSGSTVHVLRT